MEKPLAARPATPDVGTMKVPPFDLQRQNATLRDDLLGALERIVDSGQFVLGKEVATFEEEMAAYLGTRHAIGLNSGTDALILALRAVGVGPGDLVVVPAFTFFATASAIDRCGARPVLVDIEPSTFNLDPAALDDLLGGRSPIHRRLGTDPEAIRAIVPVHLYGLPADLDPIQALAKPRDLPIVEDAAQALGATYRSRKVGSIGEAGCISFFPTKNLGAFGDGGLVATDDPEIADRVRLLRNHGSRQKYQHEVLGTNSRLDAMQAAILRVKLPHLDGWLERRRTLARRYSDRLREVPGIETPDLPPESSHAFHQYTIRVADSRRDALREHLTGDGIASTIYYPSPLSAQPALASLGHEPGDFPESERASREVLSLPLFPELTEEECDRVCESIRGRARQLFVSGPESAGSQAPRD